MTMLDSLRQWNDTVGQKFSTAANAVNEAYRRGIEAINGAIQSANATLSQRVQVQSHGQRFDREVIR